MKLLVRACLRPSAALPAFVAAALLAALVRPSPAQDAPFDLERLMADPEWIARSPEAPHWSLDGRQIVYRRARAGSEIRDVFELDAVTGEQRPVPAAERTLRELSGGHFDPATGRVAVEHRGDLFLWRAGDGAAALTRTRENERDPVLLTDGRRLAFRRGDAVFARDLENGLEQELVRVLAERDPERRRVEEDEKRGHLARREEQLFEHRARERRRADERRAHDDELAAADLQRAPEPWYVGPDQVVRAMALAPSGRHVALRLAAKDAEDAPKDVLAEWVTASGYVTSRPVRRTVGTQPRSPERLVLLDLAERRRIDVDLAALPGASTPAKDDAVADQPGDEHAEGAPSAAPPPVRIRRLAWSPDGTRLAVLARSSDDHQRWIAWIDPEGTVETVHHLVDEAWVNRDFEELGWLPDGSGFWFLGEDTGWSHLYLVDVASGERRALTAGAFEVDEVVVDRAGRGLWWRTSEGDLAAQEVAWLPLAEPGAEPRRATSFGGRLEFEPSPDGTQLLLRASRVLQPPELFVVDVAPDGPPEEARRLTHTVEADFAALDWVEPVIVPVPAREDRVVWSRLFLPPAGHGAPAGERSAVLFVHGAGYLQQAHRGWSHYFRESLFHTLLARRGALVLEMDYRASAGYGRDWRTAIRLGMGGPELDDLEDGVAWLVAEHGVDPERVGVYGGSYGGFLTLHALFTRPTLFACGAALRPVTDWAHYSDGYTANILDTPDAAPEAYVASSPIDHAAGLERPLLITHGLIDDNVLPKDSVRLAQRLIELGKEDWELALYPVEPHGFRDPASWLDQYRRILRLFERHLGLTARGN